MKLNFFAFTFLRDGSRTKFFKVDERNCDLLETYKFLCFPINQSYLLFFVIQVLSHINYVLKLYLLCIEWLIYYELFLCYYIQILTVKRKILIYNAFFYHHYFIQIYFSMDCFVNMLVWNIYRCQWQIIINLVAHFYWNIFLQLMVGLDKCIKSFTK